MFGNFGAGKLKNIGGDLGSAIKSFKEGMNDKDEPKKKQKTKIKKTKIKIMLDISFRRTMCSIACSDYLYFS